MPMLKIQTNQTISDPGQLVSPGNVAGKSLLVIENVDVLRGVMTVPADEATLIRIGAPVVLIGFGDVHYKGDTISASDALTAAGLEPLELAPKEGLALLNGTQVSKRSPH